MKVELLTRIKSSLIIVFAFLFLILCMMNIQFPFVSNSSEWDLTMRILIFLQLMVLQILLLYEFLKTIARQNIKLLLGIISTFCLANLFFSFDITTGSLFFYFEDVSTDGIYLGILLKGLITLSIVILFGRKFKIYGMSTACYSALYILLTFIPLCYQMLLRKQFPGLFLALLLAIIFDITGYLGGKKFGKRRNITSISPNKTMAGYFIGMSSAFGIAFILYAGLAIISNFELTQMLKSKNDLYEVLMMILFLSFIAPAGDLLFSKIKRDYGLKDFSNLIPGHGGLLDRLDSITTTLFMIGIISFFV